MSSLITSLFRQAELHNQVVQLDVWHHTFLLTSAWFWCSYVLCSLVFLQASVSQAFWKHSPSEMDLSKELSGLELGYFSRGRECEPAVLTGGLSSLTEPSCCSCLVTARPLQMRAANIQLFQHCHDAGAELPPVSGTSSLASAPSAVSAATCSGLENGAAARLAEPSYVCLTQCFDNNLNTRATFKWLWLSVWETLP